MKSYFVTIVKNNLGSPPSYETAWYDNIILIDEHPIEWLIRCREECKKSHTVHLVFWKEIKCESDHKIRSWVESTDKYPSFSIR